jgi:hypothetical protein
MNTGSKEHDMVIQRGCPSHRQADRRPLVITASCDLRRRTPDSAQPRYGCCSETIAHNVRGNWHTIFSAQERLYSFIEGF